MIILIVVVAIILVAILMSSPTCKKAVSGIFKGKKEVASKPKVAEPIAPKPKPRPPQPISIPDPKQNTDNPVFPPNQQGVVQPQASVPAMVPDPQQNVDNPEFPPHQRGVVQPQASFPVLSGNLYNLLDPKVDVKANFGISEEELNVMARKYKETPLDTPKPEIIRNRYVNRSAMERAENVLLQSFISSTGSGQRPDTEQLVVEVMRDRVASEQRGKEKRLTSRKPTRR
jgi:hypothetical protein